MSSIASADGLIRARIADAGSERMAWAEGLEVSWPAAVLAAAGSPMTARGEIRLPAQPPPLGPEVIHELRLRASFTTVPPQSSRLPVSYRLVPGPLRRMVASAIGRTQRAHVERWAQFPRWPIDVSADVLEDWMALDSRDRAHATGRAPVILTHDLDSPEGLRNLVREFLPLEEAHGARSTSFVVPCAWPLDEGLLREACDRGHHLGIHGYDHSNRTAFVGEAERRARLDAARPLAERFEMIGYRAPSLLRTRALLDEVGARYQYDSSVPTSGGLFPVPNNGCASARPFRIGPLLEIPISLPRDGSLRFLGYRPDEILETWKACANVVHRARGVVVLLTHCERHFSGNRAMQDTYRRFLEWVRDEERFVWAAPPDVFARA